MRTGRLRAPVAGNHDSAAYVPSLFDHVEAKRAENPQRAWCHLMSENASCVPWSTVG
jgi:hypothetical protein